MINWATGGRNWGLAGAVALKYDAGGEPRYLKLENGMIAQLQESHCISPLRQCVCGWCLTITISVTTRRTRTRNEKGWHRFQLVKIKSWSKTSPDSSKIEFLASWPSFLSFSLIVEFLRVQLRFHALPSLYFTISFREAIFFPGSVF